MDTIPGDEAMPNPPHPPLAGLDPAALLKQGVAGDTLLEESSALHPPSIEDLTPLFPQFEFLELIGQGGMGAVYKVRQKELDRVVALKVLPPAIGGTAGFSERFAREAKALARLNHPGIVTIHEFGKTASSEQPLYFILMEFVDGVNLAQLMKAGRIAPREALAIVPQICDALQSAHDQGIVHRDIKPENILLDRLGRVKVADFGIAKVVGNVASVDGRPSGDGAGENPPQPDATLGGKIIGTPQYMAPEQIDSPAEVDHRADIYALGVVFYQMLTGELPGKDLQAPSRKVGIDVRLDEMVLRALDQNPERRYQTAQEFRTVVDDMHAVPPPPLQPKRGMFRRWWWVFLVMLVIGPVVGLGAASIFAHFVPKKYVSEVVVELKPRDGRTMNPTRFGIEFEKIKSTASLTEIAKQLDLSKKWGVRGERQAVSILKGIVLTENIRGTDLISITVRNTKKEGAMDIARAVVLTYKRNSSDELVIHEGPTVPESPITPNIPLLLVMGGAGGLLLSPLMALLLIPLCHWLFPERRKDGTAGGNLPVWIIVTLLLVVTALGLAVGGAALGYVTLGNVTTSSPPGVTGGMTAEDEEREKVAVAHANQYLDLVLDLAVTESSNPGEFHPDRVARRNKLNRFNAAYPDMPDMPDARCIGLAGERLRNLEERMAELKRKGLDEKHPDHARLKVRADALREVISGKNRLSEEEARKAETLQSRTNTGESSRHLRWLVEMNPPLAPEGEVSREIPKLPLKTEAAGWTGPDGRFNPVMYLVPPARAAAQGEAQGGGVGKGNRRFSLYRGVNPVAADNRFLGSYEIQAEPETDNLNMGFSLSPNGVLYFEAWTDSAEVKLTGWQTRPGDDSPGMQPPVAAPSQQERLVDLEVSFITLRKMYNPDQADVRKAAMAVDDFIRENPTAREGNYMEVLMRRRKTVLVRMEEAKVRYLDRHPASVAIRNEQEAIDQLARITRHLVIRKPRNSVPAEVKYRFDCSGDTMAEIVHQIRKKYGIRFSFEADREKEQVSEPVYYSDLIIELEMKECAGRATDREKERLAGLRKFQTPESVGTGETRYYGEIIAGSDQDLLEQLTQDTPYGCRPCVDGRRWLVSPREGSLLDYPVTLDTQGLTVEQAAERIAAQSPEGKVRLDDNVPKEPESRPWCHVACEPRKFENQPAWEVLCEIGARGNADVVYDLISGLVIQPGEWRAPEEKPPVDDAGVAASNQYLDLICEMAEADATGLGKSHPDQVILRKKFDRFTERYPRMPDDRCRRLAAQRLLDMDEEMMVLKDRGLGEKHPEFVRLRSRAEALQGIVGKKDPVTVTTALLLLSDGRITMDGTEVSRESLFEILKTLRGRSEDVKVSIGTGEGVAYEKVTEIIDLFQKCGIWNVSFERRDGKQQPDEVADWLGKMDAGEYAACYSVSAEIVRKAVSEEKWKEAMVMFRTPMGGVVSRRMLKSEVVKQLPGMPVGEHRVMQFETEFTNKKAAVETVIFTKENDGAWKSSGYFIR